MIEFLTFCFSKRNEFSFLIMKVEWSVRDILLRYSAEMKVLYWDGFSVGFVARLYVQSWSETNRDGLSIVQRLSLSFVFVLFLSVLVSFFSHLLSVCRSWFDISRLFLQFKNCLQETILAYRSRISFENFPLRLPTHSKRSSSTHPN